MFAGWLQGQCLQRIGTIHQLGRRDIGIVARAAFGACIANREQLITDDTNRRKRQDRPPAR